MTYCETNSSSLWHGIKWIWRLRETLRYNFEEEWWDNGGTPQEYYYSVVLISQLSMMRILIRPTYDRLRHSLRSPTLVGVDSQLTGNQLAYDRAVALHTYTHTGHTGEVYRQLYSTTAAATESFQTMGCSYMLHVHAHQTKSGSALKCIPQPHNIKPTLKS